MVDHRKGRSDGQIKEDAQDRENRECPDNNLLKKKKISFVEETYQKCMISVTLKQRNILVVK